MKYFLGILFLATLSQASLAESYSFTGRVTLIEKDYLVVEGSDEKLILVNEHSPAHVRIGSRFKTKYIVPGGRETSFQTLASVGWIEKAKVTISNNLVKEIIVLEMWQ